jgi:hypothetical protein
MHFDLHRPYPINSSKRLDGTAVLLTAFQPFGIAVYLESRFRRPPRAAIGCAASYPSSDAPNHDLRLSSWWLGMALISKTGTSANWPQNGTATDQVGASSKSTSDRGEPYLYQS